MAVSKVKLIRGDTWLRTWILNKDDGTPFDLTGATLRLHVRSPSDTLLSEATTINGRLTISSTNRIDLKMPKEETQNWPIDTLNFDIELTLSDGFRITLEQGIIIVLKDYTYP